MSEHEVLIVEASSSESRSIPSYAEVERSGAKDVVDGSIGSQIDKFPQAPHVANTIVEHKHFIENATKEKEDTAMKSDDGMGTDRDKGKHEMHDSLMAECRICQEEDQTTNLEAPCYCSGSLKFVHRKCLQHWCNEKGDVICEICRKPFEGGYTIPRPSSENSSIDVRHVVLDMGEPQLFTITRNDQFLEDEYASTNVRSAACLRSVALILMALLLLRHLLSMAVADADEDASTFFMLFVLRAAGFLLPFYIMARAFNTLQYRHQHEQEVTLRPAEVAYLIQAGDTRGVHITVSPSTAA